MVWKIGPECIAQQAKNVAASTMNCGERSARPTVMLPPAPAMAAPGAPAPAGGARRTSNAVGTSNAQARMAITSWAVRQS